MPVTDKPGGMIPVGVQRPDAETAPAWVQVILLPLPVPPAAVKVIPGYVKPTKPLMTREGRFTVRGKLICRKELP